MLVNGTCHDYACATHPIIGASIYSRELDQEVVFYIPRGLMRLVYFLVLRSGKASALYV